MSTFYLTQPARRFYWLSAIIALSMIAAIQPITAANDAIISSEEASLRAAAESVADSVVQIRTIGGLDAVDGTLLADGPTTGLIISSDGYVVSSAFNFVQQPSSILVTLVSGKQVSAELVATDHSRMIVLLKLTGVADLPVPTMAPAGEVKTGQWAIAVGRTFRADRVNMTVGIVSAINRMFGKAIQTDASVSISCYGGPLVDIRGRVIGLIVPMAPQATSEVAGAEWYDSGIGFAVPLEPIAQHIEQMKKGEDLHPGMLGIGMESENPHSAPAELAAVRPDSPAGKAGLKKGDRIIEVEGQPISNQTALRFALGTRYAGESVRVVAQRADEKLERTIELAGKLPAFRHPFLGILPVRPSTIAETEENAPNGKVAKTEEGNAGGKEAATVKETDQVASMPTGLAVRMVYSGSPAEKAGVRIGDVITKIDETEIKSIDDAIGALNNQAPGNDVKLKLLRNEQSLDLIVKAERMPANIPAELPSAYVNEDEDAGEDTADTKDVTAAGETVDLKLPEFPNLCKVYIPASHQAKLPQAALMWLQLPDDSNADELIAQWKAICERDGVILIVPSPAEASRWERTEVEYLRRLTERAIAEYKIDPRRVVVYGQGGGGAIAWLLGLSSRDLYRGIATSSAALPRQIKLPPNEPSQRMAIFAGIPAGKEVAAQMAQGLEKLSEAGYPISTITDVEPKGALNESQRSELARWIDTLDRF